MDGFIRLDKNPQIVSGSKYFVVVSERIELKLRIPARAEGRVRRTPEGNALALRGVQQSRP